MFKLDLPPPKQLTCMFKQDIKDEEKEEEAKEFIAEILYLTKWDAEYDIVTNAGLRAIFKLKEK